MRPAPSCLGILPGSADDERLELFHQIFAVVGVDLQRDGLGEVEAEDAQNRLSVHHVTAHAQVDVVGIAVGDIDKRLYILCETELDVNCLHDCPLISS